MQKSLYDTQGKESGNIQLNDDLFNIEVKDFLIYEKIKNELANARVGTASTKTRDEVRGGGKKPWRQKGTGRARHGSIRSPIWKGGGVTHGPRTDKDYSRRIPRKMRMKALYVALSEKFKAGHLLFVDTIAFAEPKTTDAKSVLVNLATIKGFEKLVTKKNNVVLVSLSSNDKNTKKSFANFGNVNVEETRNLNPIDVLSTTYLIIENPEEAVKELAKKTNE